MNEKDKEALREVHAVVRGMTDMASVKGADGTLFFLHRDDLYRVLSLAGCAVESEQKLEDAIVERDLVDSAKLLEMRVGVLTSRLREAREERERAAMTASQSDTERDEEPGGVTKEDILNAMDGVWHDSTGKSVGGVDFSVVSKRVRAILSPAEADGPELFTKGQRDLIEAAIVHGIAAHHKQVESRRDHPSPILWRSYPGSEW